MIIQYAIILLLVATMAAVCLMMIPHKVDAQYNLPSHYRRRNDHSVSKLLEEIKDLELSIYGERPMLTENLLELPRSLKLPRESSPRVDYSIEQMSSAQVTPQLQQQLQPQPQIQGQLQPQQLQPSQKSFKICDELKGKSQQNYLRSVSLGLNVLCKPSNLQDPMSTQTLDTIMRQLTNFEKFVDQYLEKSADKSEPTRGLRYDRW